METEEGIENMTDYRGGVGEELPGAGCLPKAHYRAMIQVGIGLVGISLDD